MTSPTSALDVFAVVEKDFGDDPPIKRLREIRDIFDDPAYITELVRNVRAINDPEILSDLLARLRRLRRDLEEKRDEKRHNKEMVVQMGVTGGVGLVAGSIIAAASATFPPMSSSRSRAVLGWRLPAIARLQSWTRNAIYMDSWRNR